ncbi:uncharacterized protein METZ01_LOCUS36838 [marine metagenome]|uniref:Uncharacterized protein n=1 Tax=marine metagenome TaxID=408172 RepID=A0A381QYD3_9ZZZZ
MGIGRFTAPAYATEEADAAVVPRTAPELKT